MTYGNNYAIKDYLYIKIMKIILTKDVPNLGQKGKVAEVKFGFGKNWLIPQGLAILATPSLLKQI